MGSDFDSFDQSPLGEFFQSALHERGLVLAAQKHIGTAADEAANSAFMDGTDPRLVDADSSGIYFYMGLSPSGTEYEVAFLSADGETLNSVRKITPLGFSVPLAFAATSNHVFLFGRTNPTFLSPKTTVWRMTKGSFDLRYREYLTSGVAPARAVRASDNQILVARGDRLLWINDDLSVDTVNAYSGGDSILDLVYDGGNLYIGGIRSGALNPPFYARINAAKDAADHAFNKHFKFCNGCFG